MSYFSQTVASSLTGSKPPPVRKPEAVVPEGASSATLKPGIVTIIDFQRVRRNENTRKSNTDVRKSTSSTKISVNEDSNCDEFIAHFPAHASEAICALEFDPSGHRLVTADKLGHNFHVFRIMAHPHSCAFTAVHHLYTLHRGDTGSKV